MISRRTFPSISATAASVDRPRPTDSSIIGVAAPGRCRLAMPRRADGLPTSDPARAASITQAAAEAEQDHRAQGGGAEPEREAAVGGGGDGERDQARHDGSVRRQQRARRTGAFGEQRVAEQRPTGDTRRAAKRPEREGERGQQAIGRGEQERSGIEAENRRHRQHVLEPGGQRDRRQRTARKPDDDATEGESQDLDQADGQHQGGGCAETAQCRDGAGAGVEPGANAVGDPDATDQKGGQADQRHEQAGLFDEAGDAGRGAARIADAPALVGEVATERGKGGRGVGQGGADGVLHHGAGRDQAGRSQRICGDQHAGAEDQRGGDAVRFGDQGAADGEAGVAEAHGVAGVEVQAVQDDPFGQKAVVGQGGGDTALGLGPRPPPPSRKGRGSICIRG